MSLVKNVKMIEVSDWDKLRSSLEGKWVAF